MSDVPAPESFYVRVGGAEGVRALVDRFYDLMDQLEEARALRAMHPALLGESRDKLYAFLSGWLGGPPLFVQQYGHPRLRARHMPFAIDNASVDAWMLCMTRALEQCVSDAEAREKLTHGLLQLARHMKNIP